MSGAARRTSSRPFLFVCVVALLAPGARAVPAAATGTTEAVAAWQQRAPGGDWDIWFSDLTRPSADDAASRLAWSAPSPLAAFAGDDENVQITVQPGTGVALAVWQNAISGGLHQIMWSRRASGAWSTPALIASTAGDDVDPTVAIDQDGRALVVWVQRTPGGAGLRWARLDGVRFDSTQWSEPSSIPGDITRASLPELTFLAAPSTTGSGHRALVAFADRIDDPGPVMRTRVAAFDGVAWAAAQTIPLAVDQRSIMPAHGSGDYATPQGAFARLDVGAEADGDAVVLWGGPVAEDLSTRYASAGLMGAHLRATDLTWSAVRAQNGSPLLGGPGCKAPAMAMTGSEDFVAAFTSDGFLEQQRVPRATPAVEATAYNTAYDDVRPALAPLGDAVILVATGLGYPGDEVTPPSVITWSIGTLRPASGGTDASTTFDAPKTMTLPGEARYPSVASVLGGTENPLAVEMRGRGVALGVTDGPGSTQTWGDTGDVASTGPGQDEVWLAVTPPNAVVRAVGGYAANSRGDDTSTTVVSLTEVVFATAPPVVVRGLRVSARASCPDGRSGGTVAGSIQVGAEPPMALDARENMSIPLGAFTLRINERASTARSVTVRGLRLTGVGVDVTVGAATAGVAGCVGSGEPVASLPHDH